MSLKYISESYGVPAKKGQRIIYTGLNYPRPGEIVGSHDASIKVIFDDEPETTKLYNPVWDMEYVESEEV